MKRSGCSVMVFMLIIMLLVVGYDQYRIEQLRSEVAAISGKIHVENGTKRAPAAKSDLVTALAEAEHYTRSAKEMLNKKNVAQAQAELDKALKKLNSANMVSKDIVGDAAQFLGKAKENTVQMFENAWKSISEDPKSQKTPEKK